MNIRALLIVTLSLAGPASRPASAADRDADAGRASALADYDRAIERDPKNASAYARRGVARFMLGQIDGAIADFDKQIALDPDAKPHHWQRGIALYYAGRFEEGTKQFELHRTVNPDDVENAAWHFLCLARWKDVATARAALIPIDGDARVPMMKVHELFAGKATIEDVMNEAKRGDPAPDALNRHLFYAQLYVGLYCEAVGKNDQARQHLEEAAKHVVPDYMYGVAKVHLKRLAPAIRPAARQ
jgi:lipoprotein NlpI